MRRVDWWALQPWWFKRLRLFCGIVWREGYDGKPLGASVSWQVATVVHPHPRTSPNV